MVINHVCVYVYVCMYVYICVCVYIYIYIYIYIYECKHTHTLSLSQIQYQFGVNIFFCATKNTGRGSCVHAAHIPPAAGAFPAEDDQDSDSDSDSDSYESAEPLTPKSDGALEEASLAA
jgi:hypothetical protein